MHIHLVAGKPIVYVPKNDVSSMPLRGAVAVLSEKFKPGTMSDGALLQGAYQAGADAVIKIGGGGLDSSEKRANQVVNRETQYCKHPSSQLLKLLGFMVHHPKYTALGDDSLGFTSFEVAMSRSSGFSVIFRAGAMLYSVPDPSEIPCFAISEDDGKKLCSALEVRIYPKSVWMWPYWQPCARQVSRSAKVKELKVNDRRQKLQAERWNYGKVWLHFSGRERPFSQ